MEFFLLLYHGLDSFLRGSNDAQPAQALLSPWHVAIGRSSNFYVCLLKFFLVLLV